MKLYLMVCNFEKYLKVNQIAFNTVKKLAKDNGFDIDVAYISQSRYTTEEEIKQTRQDYKHVNFYLYDNMHTENECIFDCMQKCKADRYFVCDARYLENEVLIRDMLYCATYYDVHFVRCKKTYTGIFEPVVKFFKKVNNKVLDYISSSKRSSYVRNLVIFDSIVYDYMMRSPINSGVIRETDFLVNTNDIILNVQMGFKKANHFVHNWANYLIGSTCLFLAVWSIVCLFTVSNSFNMASWLIFAFIAFGVVGFVVLLSAMATSKTLFYRPYAQRRETLPVFELVKDKKNLNKKKVEEEINKTNTSEKNNKTKITKTKTKKEN